MEWGYGGMGSVKTAAAVGADNKWSRVSGSSAAFGEGEAGWGKGDRGRRPADDEDDGSGMAWLKRRREQRERERKEAEERAAKETAEKEKQEQPLAEIADANPPAEDTVKPADEAKEQPQEENTSVKEPEHITTAVAVPAYHRPSLHAHSRSMERVPSAASYHVFRTPERRDSEDTARAISPSSPPMSGHVIEPGVVGEMDDVERISTARVRRESESSMTSTDSFSTEDDDADVEDSPKSSGGEDDEEESDDDVSTYVEYFAHLTDKFVSCRSRPGGLRWAQVSRKSAGTKRSPTRRTPMARR